MAAKSVQHQAVRLAVDYLDRLGLAITGSKGVMWVPPASPQVLKIIGKTRPEMGLRAEVHLSDAAEQAIARLQKRTRSDAKAASILRRIHAIVTALRTDALRGEVVKKPLRGAGCAARPSAS